MSVPAKLMRPPHHPHVVLDHQKRDLLRFGERAGGGDRAVRLGFAHAGCRLVHEEQRRPGSERAGEIHSLQHTERQLGRDRVAIREEIETLQHRQCLARGLVLTPMRKRRGERGVCERHVRMAADADQHVIQYRKLRERLDMLERPADAPAADRMRGQSRHG